jgi:hypothetical protein
MNDNYGVNKLKSVSSEAVNGCNKQNLTDRVNSISQVASETKSIVNEISYKLFGDATAKITEGCCTPTQPSIENTINDLQMDTSDIKRMLIDILEAL